MLLEEVHCLAPIAGFCDVHHVGLTVDNSSQPDANHEVVLHNHGANSATICCRVHAFFSAGGLDRHFDKQLGPFTRSAAQSQAAANSLSSFAHSNQAVMPAASVAEALQIKSVAVIAHAQREAV